MTLRHRSILQLTAMMTSNTATASAIAQATINAIVESADPAVFIKVTLERARAEADAATTRIAQGRPLGLLDGIPVAWKDLYDLKDEVTRAGSLILDEGPAAADAELVHRLTAAGTVTVGKLNMTEFAFSGLGLNPHYGTPRNPWCRTDARIPGGSSSGSGVAVALGLVPIAIGTDTSGSVRIPAALNGIVGFKTSGGRWPDAGRYPLSRTLDTSGVLTNTVVDAAIVDAAARGLPAPDVRPRSLAGIRLLIPTNAVWADVEPAVASNFEAAIHRLESNGVRVERRPLKVLDDVLSLGLNHGTLVALEAYQVHRHRLTTAAAARMDRRVRARLEAGGAIDARAEAILRGARPVLIETLAPLFDGNTFVAYPTVPFAAPLIAPLEADDDLFTRTNTLMLRNTLIGSFLGWCGVSIPSGLNEQGLPTAILLSAGPGNDGELLSAAMSMEPVIRGQWSFKLPR